MPKEKLVIDVNIFLASFFFRSKMCDRILDSVKEKIFILLSCQELIEELQNKVSQFENRISNQELVQIKTWFDFLENTANFIKLTSKLKVCRDPKDDYLVNLALDGLAKFLITRDKDLIEISLPQLQNIVVTPENFMKVLNKR